MSPFAARLEGYRPTRYYRGVETYTTNYGQVEWDYAKGEVTYACFILETEGSDPLNIRIQDGEFEVSILGMYDTPLSVLYTSRYPYKETGVASLAPLDVVKTLLKHRSSAPAFITLRKTLLQLMVSKLNLNERTRGLIHWAFSEWRQPIHVERTPILTAQVA